MNLNHIVLALACIGSGFVGWGVFRFFTKPDGKMAPAMVWLTRLSYVGMIVQIADLLRTDPPPRVHSLIAIGMMGLAYLTYWSSIAVHRHQPPSLAYSKDAPERLVTRGPYALIRHPFYTSYLIAWLAPAIATGRLTSFAVALVMAVFFELAARQEERKFLSSELGAEYARYIAHTGRFLPNPWKTLRGVFGRRIKASQS